MNPTIDHPFARRTLRLGLAAMALALPLTACGGDDSESSDTTVAASSGSDAGSGSGASSDADADAAAKEMITDAALGDGGGMGLDLETRADVLQSALKFDDYSIDGSTITVSFDEGSNEFDSPVVCISGGAIMDEGETLVVEYPDGSTTC
jgi:hypothetical protein